MSENLELPKSPATPTPKFNQSQYYKLWYAQNKEKQKAYNSQKVKCDKCGAELTRANLYKHKKTKKCNGGKAEPESDIKTELKETKTLLKSISEQLQKLELKDIKNNKNE